MKSFRVRSVREKDQKKREEERNEGKNERRLSTQVTIKTEEESVKGSHEQK
jgi:hypothetical protein